MSDKPGGLILAIGPPALPVDDDEAVGEPIPVLLRLLGYMVRVFSCAEEFLACDCIDQTRCLILDIWMPGMSGIELQRELKRRGYDIAIVFISANEDDASRTLALAQGAVAYLTKPFREAALIEALERARAKTW
jgi:FixJ family two-component response regulator